MALYDLSTGLGISTTLLVIVMIWTLIWKGIALWISARKTHKIWFIVLLIFNTIGVLEILYIFIFSKLGKVKAKTAVKKEEKLTKKKK